MPTLWEQGLWDQEDMWGANHSFAALKAAGHEANNWLVMGPWFHSQVNREGWNLGPFKWDGDTARQFRRDMVLPFFNQYLKDGPPANLRARDDLQSRPKTIGSTSPTGRRRARKAARSRLTPIYLQAGFGLSFDKPARRRGRLLCLRSCEARALPAAARAFLGDPDAWRTWLVRDQRFVDGRPDVLSYETRAALTEAIKLEGAPIVDSWPPRPARMAISSCG